MKDLIFGLSLLIIAVVLGIWIGIKQGISETQFAKLILAPIILIIYLLIKGEKNTKEKH